MTITVEHLKDRKAYVTALKTTLKARAKGPFLYVEHKFDGGAATGILLLGPKFDDLKKDAIARKAKVLDQGSFEKGVLRAKGGKLSAAALEKLGIEAELATVAADDDAAASAPGKPASSAEPRKLPGLGITAAAATAQLEAWKKDIGGVTHPGLKAALVDALRAAAQQLGSDDWKGIDRKFSDIERQLGEAEAAAKLLADLERMRPVAGARKEPEAATIFADAKAAYDKVDLATAGMHIRRFERQFGHNPYADAAQGESGLAADASGKGRVGSATRAAQAGSLSLGYERLKRELETRLTRMESEPDKYDAYQDEVVAARAFLKKVANGGLKDKLAALDGMPAGPQRKAALEKAILLVQAYITGLAQAIKESQVTMEYRNMLQHIHAELSKMMQR